MGCAIIIFLLGAFAKLYTYVPPEGSPLYRIYQVCFCNAAECAPVVNLVTRAQCSARGPSSTHFAVGGHDALIPLSGWIGHFWLRCASIHHLLAVLLCVLCPV
jgi:hypothetical protein